MKQFLAESPFFRLLVAFISGILCQYYCQFNYHISFVIFITFLLLNLLVFFMKNHVQLFKIRYFSGVLLSVLVISTAIFVSSLSDARISQSHYSHYLSDHSKYEIMITEDPVKTNTGIRFKGNVVNIILDTVKIKTTGKISVFIKDSLSNCSYGDLITSSGNPELIHAAENPYEFDNRTYLAHKNIYYQLFVNNEKYKVIAHNKTNGILLMLHQIRTYLSQCFEESMQDKNAASVAKALILGDDDDIDSGLMKAYSSCGVIHVLSVSGLHVGIFFIIVNYLFGLIKSEHRAIRITKAIITITLIWFYAALSGFSPSVLRSAVMLSFVVVGTSMGRRISIYNSLSASCLFLLFYNVNYLFDVGFQLSYIAVFGILYLQPKVYQLWAVKNYFGDKIWQMTSVSLAAQLVTFPLSVYYFYQFPTLFLFANLLIIPLVTFALIAGFAFLILCSYHSQLFLFYAVKPLEYLLIVINQIVLTMDKISFNAIKNIFLSPFETLLLYLVFISFFLWIELRKVFLLQVFLGMAFFFMIFLSYQKMDILNSKTLIVYSLNKMQRIEWVQAGFSQVITTQHLELKDKNFVFHIQPFRVHQKVKKSNESLIGEGNYIFSFGHFKVLFLNAANTNISPIKENFDIILVGHNAIKDFDLFKKNIHYRHLVFDNSNSNHFITQAKTNHLDFYNIKTDRAFVLHL